HEFLLSSLALRALDPATRRHFELSLGSTSTSPNVEKIIDFVRQRKLALKMSQDLGVRTSSTWQNASPRRHPGKYFLGSDDQSGP
ncbi:hypothetical protein, partial [Klebsiella pneumoniae]|uniref:hypothetical protein n=1 Tax=Klebsiella pneumoniae TaxID=573 RepID=UPI0040557057